MSHPRRQHYAPLKMAEPAPVMERVGNVPTLEADRERMEAMRDLMAGGMLMKDAAPQVFGSTSSMFRAMDRYPQLRRTYDEARLLLAHRLAEESVSVADTEPDVQRAKLKSEVRRWYAAKASPKDFGDRVAIDLSGEVSVLAALTTAESRSLHALPPVIEAEVVPDDPSPARMPGLLE